MTNYETKRIKEETAELIVKLHKELKFLTTSDTFMFTKEASDLMSIYKKLTDNKVNKNLHNALFMLGDNVDKLKRVNSLYSQAQQDGARVLEYIANELN